MQGKAYYKRHQHEDQPFLDSVKLELCVFSCSVGYVWDYELATLSPKG